MNPEARGVFSYEERALPGVELREGEHGLSFTGVASTVEQPYVVHDMFGEFEETMAENAFKKSIREGDQRLLVNHEGVPIARTGAGTLKLSTDPHLVATAPNLDSSNPKVVELASAISRGDLDAMSIGFSVTKQKWNDDYTVRRVEEVRLFEVSAVTFPANPNTTATIRSLLRGAPDLTDERSIRAAITQLESLLADPEPEGEEFDPLELETWYRRLEHKSRRVTAA